MRAGRPDRRPRPRRRHGRRRAGRFLLDHQSPHRRPHRRPLARRPAAAHGRHRRHQRRTARGPPAASCATCARGDRVVCGTDGIRIVPEFQERDRQHFAFMANDISSERRVEATVAADRAGDARRARHAAADRLRRRPGRGAHGRRALLLAADSHRLGGRAAGRQRHRRPRHRVVLLRHLARRRSRAGRARARRPQAPHEGDQPGQPRRRHRAGGRVRRAHERRHVRPGHAPRAVRARRQHPRRRAAARHGDGPDRGAGALCACCSRAPAWW